MRVKESVRFCSSLFLLLAACLLLLSSAPAAAQSSSDVVIGRVVDSEEAPAIGFRVVFREVDDYQVALSQPTDSDGEYFAADELIKITSEEAQAYYDAANSLYAMYEEATEHVIRHNLFD